MLAIAQSVKEVVLIKKKASKMPTILALNLEIILYCKINKIDFITPFQNSNYHNTSKKILLNSKKLLDSFDLSVLKYDFLINDLRAIIRCKFNQVAFLIETINNIKHKYEKIIYTNLYSKPPDHGNTKKFFGEEYINIEDTLNILKLNNLEKIEISKEKEKEKEKNKKLYSYEIKGLKYKKEKKIILNNAGYNFKRIIYFFLKTRLKIAVPKNDLNFLKKIIFYILGIELYKFQKNKEVIKNIDIPKLTCNFVYENYDLSEIINKEISIAKFYLANLVEKYKAFLTYFDLSNLKLVVCNANREIGSILFEAASRKNVKSIIISHGTISKSYDEYDKIYKEYIAEGVFLGRSNIKTIQSKISKKSLETLTVSGNIVETGNLIFSENLKNNSYDKKNILYAVTNKRLPGLQIHGVEYFFEFFNNLELLNNFSKKNQCRIIIHLHPGAIKNLNNLKKIFKNLNFHVGDISTSLKKSFVTISYSSTVIEDSLYNKVPVILLDLHKKNYIHFESELNPEIKNKSLYYINNLEDLKKCIDTIRQSKKINFNEYIYDKEAIKNVRNFFKNYIK